MIRPLPGLIWFRAFDSAARHLSFNRTAADLGLTQSATSQHVRTLENGQGTALFVRKPRGLALTDAGRRLVQDIATAMASLTSATAGFDTATTRDVLTIAASASIAQWSLAPRLAAFHETHPHIALRFVTTVWPDDFSATAADIEIRFGAPDVVGHLAEQLLPSRIGTVAAPILLAVSGRDFDWSQLASLPLIQPVGISTQWRDIQELLRLPQTAEPQVFVDTRGLGVDLACSGAGGALAHALIAGDALAAGRIVAMPIPDIPALEGQYLAFHPTKLPQAQPTFAGWPKTCRSDFDDSVSTA